jgi:hypothetical protein
MPALGALLLDAPDQGALAAAIPVAAVSVLGPPALGALVLG